MYTDEEEEHINVKLKSYIRFFRLAIPIFVIFVIMSFYIGSEIIRYFIFFTFGKADDKNFSKDKFFL